MAAAVLPVSRMAVEAVTVRLLAVSAAAAISGDFMLLPTELNPVIKALRANGIEVASIHNHLLDNQPSMVFMHFWAYGDAVSLARGLKAALDRTAS